MFRIENITKTVKIRNEEVFILQNISFTLPKSGLFFICGPSGSGKTTLINILEGVDGKYKGKVIYKGKELKKKKSSNTWYLKNEISILFQESALDKEKTVIENIVFRLNICGINNKTAYEVACTRLKEWNLEHLKNKPIKMLSGGERERIDLICSLIKNSSVIFCDEPTGALDEGNSKQVMDELRKNASDKLVIVITHNSNLVKQYGDGVIEINDGKIVSNSIEETKYEETMKLNHKVHSRFFSIFSKLFSNNLKTNIFSFVILTFSLVLLLVTLSTIGWSKNINDQLLPSYVNSNYAEMTENTKLKENSNVESYVLSRPNVAEIKNIKQFKNMYIDYNFDYIFNNFSKINNNKDNKVIRYLPHMLNKTSFYVNKEFYETFRTQNFKIDIDGYFSEHYNEKETNDYIKTKINVTNANIINEFNIYKTVKIYYPYSYIKKIFQNLKMKYFSDVLKKEINLYDYIRNVNKNSSISSYKLVLFCINSKETINPNNEELKQNGYEIINNNYEEVNLFSQSIKSFSEYFMMLLLISCLGTFFLICFKTYEYICKNKRLISIMEFNGFSINHIIEVKELEILIISTISMIFSYLLCRVIFNFGCGFARKNIGTAVFLDFYSPISGANDFFYFLLMILIVFVLSIINYLVLKKMEKIDIKEEMRSL